MKVLFGLLLVLMLSNECLEHHFQRYSTVQEDMTITYEASARGFYEKIWLTKDSVSFSNDRNLKTVTTSTYKSEDWNALVDLVKDINVEKLSALEPPSKMHQVDGAAMATLKIEHNNTIYKTKIFDHGHPPKAISQLVNKVLSIKEMMTKH